MAATSRKYLVTLDFWRIVSAIAIIWLHTPESDLLGPTITITRFAVPFFVASAAYMACRIRPGEIQPSLFTFVKSRFTRIYIPFLGWSAIYLLVRFVAARHLPTVQAYPLAWELFWRGPTSHLWFLPFILLATIAAHLVGRLLSARPQQSWLVLGALLALSFVVLEYPAASDGLAYTAHLSYNTLPAMLWGIALAIVASRFGTDWLAKPQTVAMAMTLFVGAELLLAINGRHIVVENLAGLSLLLGCFGEARHAIVTKIAAWGGLAYGVYLAHMLFVEGLQDISHAMRIPVSPATDIAVFILSAVCSLALTVCLKRIRWTSWLVP